MPNQRSQTGLLTEQQQQHKRVIGTVLKLSALARVSSLQGIADAVGWVVSLPSSTKAWSEHQVNQDCCRQLLGAFYAAVSNGLKQLHLNWPQSLAFAAQPFLIAVRTVYLLCRQSGLVQRWSGMEYACTAHHIALEAGVFESFASVTSQVHLTLQPQQETAGVSAQQYTAKHDEVVRLGLLLLDLWSDLLRLWPSPKLADNSLTPTIEPAASLALTLMSVLSTQIADLSSSNSSNNNSNNSSIHSSSNRGQNRVTNDSSHHSFVSRSWQASWEVSLCMSVRLMCAVYDECPVTDIDSSSSAAAIWAAVTSADVEGLLLLGLAASAAMAHKQQPGGVVPTGVDAAIGQQHDGYQQHGHLRLLAALGLNPLSLHELGELAGAVSSCPRTLHSFILVVGCLYDSLDNQHQDNQSSKASDSSDKAGTGVYDLLQSLALPVLHTLKDVMLLLHDSAEAYLLSTLCSISSVWHPEYQQWNPEEQQEVWQWLLQPLYEQLCAVACHVGQQHETGAGSGSSNAETAAMLMRAWVGMTKSTFVHDSSSVSVLANQLKDIIKQQPVTTLSALETLIRLPSPNAKQQSSSWVSRMVEAVFEALLHGGKDQLANDIKAQPRVQQQLCSFICSHLKLLMVLNTETQTDFVHEQQQLAFTAFVQELMLIMYMLTSAHYVAQLALTDQPAQQAAGRLQRRQQQLFTSWPVDGWMAMFGKAMFASAGSLVQQPRLSQGPVALSAAVRIWSANLPIALDVFEDDRVTIEAVPGCKQQLHTLEQLLVTAESAIVNGTCDEVMQQQLLAQLQQCGSSICASLPVKFCCNNPACVNLTQLSEQQLVAGKGSRCSGCKVARYCSRNCQLKHWKEHRKTCKRLKDQANSCRSTLEKQR